MKIPPAQPLTILIITKIDWNLIVGIIAVLVGIVAILTNTPTGQKFVENNIIQKMQQLIQKMQ